MDVSHLRRDGVAVRTPGIIVFREIRHDRILPGVIGIDRITGIRRAAVVRPLMAETKRVADLMNVSLVAVAIDPGLAVIRAAVVGDPVGADIDGRGYHCARVTVPTGIGAGYHAAVVI